MGQITPTGLNIHQVKPVYGESYGPGWIGFVRSFGFVSDAIAYGERWSRLKSWPQVTHAFIVSGNNECIEAHAGSGVQRATLTSYLTDPRIKTYFRQPAPCTPNIGHCIAGAAHAKIGCRYDDLLIMEQAAADSLIGHWLNRFTHNWFHHFFAKLFGRSDQFICSYLAAYAMSQQPPFAGRSILAGPLAGIDPQTLFESDLFEPFINDCSARP